MSTQERSSKGRPSFKPTAADRKLVTAMARVGVPQSEIAECVGVSVNTLRAHFRAELDLGTLRANVSVGNRLYDLAMGGNVTAAIFWLKTRAGWKENSAESNQPQRIPDFVVEVTPSKEKEPVQ